MSQYKFRSLLFAFPTRKTYRFMAKHQVSSRQAMNLDLILLPFYSHTTPKLLHLMLIPNPVTIHDSGMRASDIRFLLHPRFYGARTRRNNSPFDDSTLDPLMRRILHRGEPITDSHRRRASRGERRSSTMSGPTMIT